MWRRRIAGIAAAMAALIILSAGPASAKFSVNTAGCAGKATITGKNGKTYVVKASASKATIPREGSVAWQGSTKRVVKDHSGSIGIKIGPLTFKIDSWGSPNQNGDKTASGTRDMPSALKWAPPGKYLLTGSHAGKGGKCVGSITLTVEGSPFSTASGLGVVGGTVVFGLMTVAAGIARKPRLKARH
jgi:hypothetical protein